MGGADFYSARLDSMARDSYRFRLEGMGRAAIVRQIGDLWEDYEQLDYSRGRKRDWPPTQLLAGSEGLIRCKT